VIYESARIVLVEDNTADVLLIELALKENGIPYELTRFATAKMLCEVFVGRMPQRPSFRMLSCWT